MDARNKGIAFVRVDVGVQFYILLFLLTFMSFPKPSTLKVIILRSIIPIRDRLISR